MSTREQEEPKDYRVHREVPKLDAIREELERVNRKLDRLTDLLRKLL